MRLEATRRALLLAAIAALALLKWALRRLYYRQRRFRAEHGRFATDLAMLDAAALRVPGLDFEPSMQATASLFEISAKGFGGATLHIRQDGRATLTR